jgi:hypothetical protein
MIITGSLGVNRTVSGRGDVEIAGHYHEWSAGNGQLALLSTVSASNASGSDQGGQIVFGGPISDSDTSRTFGLIAGLKENSTENNRAGYLAFGTRRGDGDRDIHEHIKITSTGDLLFGVTNDGNKISGSSSSTGSFGDGFLDDKLFIGANHTPGIQAGDLHIASEAPGVGNIVLEAAANATSGPALYMGKARGTNASISAINHAGGDVLGNILFAGYDGAHYRTGAEITVTNQSGSSQGTDMPANMFLRVSDDGSSSPTDRLVLTHDNKISGSSTSTGSFGHGFINRRLLVGAQQATDSGEIFGVKDGVSADWAARLENTTDGG